MDFDWINAIAGFGAGALDAVMLLYLYPRRMKPSTLVGLRMLLS